MNRITSRSIFTLFIAGSLAATSAFAGERYEDDDDRDYAPEGTEYAKVTGVEPIYRTVRISEPRRECWDERVAYNNPQQPAYLFDNGIAGAVVGAIAGGVAGHQFGNGRGKDAATAAGALIGAGIGQRVAVENYGRYPGQPAAQRVGYEERCKTVENVRTEQRIESYDVSYKYNGRTYRTNMPYDPGARIPVDVEVRPRVYSPGRSDTRPVSY
jgi:uncharacterized protein YcfJ